MSAFTESFNLLSGVGTVFFQLAIISLLIIFAVVHYGKNGRFLVQSKMIMSWVRKWGLTLGFIVATSAVTGSLIYSDFIGFEPCKLCWIQRIFLYPQVLILGLAIWKKTKDAVTYCLWLSISGFIVAVYHYYGQMFNPSALPCAAAGVGSCAVRFFVEFGYITIPMMSLSVFGLLALLMYLARSNGEDQS